MNGCPGFVAAKSSARVRTSRTGRRSFCAAAAASVSSSGHFPPNAPPSGAAIALTRRCGSPSALATPLRVSNSDWVALSTTRAYVANQGSGTVSVIDLTQNPPVVVATIPVGSQPDALALRSDGARLDVANYGGASVSVIDTATNAVTRTVAVGSRPTGILELAGLVYVANLSSHSVSFFDPGVAAPTASSFTVPATGATLSAPSGLAASPDAHTLYVNDARNGKTFVFDLTQNPPASTGSVLNGAGSFPAYLAVAGSTGYSANPGTNSIRVLDLTALSATNVPVGASPYGVVALDRKSVV